LTGPCLVLILSIRDPLCCREVRTAYPRARMNLPYCEEYPQSTFFPLMPVRTISTISSVIPRRQRNTESNIKKSSPSHAALQLTSTAYQRPPYATNQHADRRLASRLELTATSEQTGKVQVKRVSDPSSDPRTRSLLLDKHVRRIAQPCEESVCGVFVAPFGPQKGGT
jgi:hypothetical protein